MEQLAGPVTLPSHYLRSTVGRFQVGSWSIQRWSQQLCFSQNGPVRGAFHRTDMSSSC